jgi:hypothetical protein
MTRRLILIAILGGSLFMSCNKEDVNEEPNQGPTLNSDTTDLSLSFNNYLADSVYFSDTIRFDYRITNLNTEKIDSGSTILAACKFGNTVFALDLIGTGPTNINVPYELNQGDYFDKNSGYLLKSSILSYFAVDSMEVSVFVYGLNGAPIDINFPKDRTPLNNIATLKIDQTSIRLK